MTSIIENHPQPMKWARHRTARFAVYGAIAFGALFGVLAVKAQIVTAPNWSHPFAVWETHR